MITNERNIKLEILLSANISEKLEKCCEIMGFAKEEIIRMGIEEIYEQAINNNAEDGESPHDIIMQAAEERAGRIYEEVYNKEFKKEYAKIYAKLIINPEIDPDEADDIATDEAKEEADETASEAVKDFWKSVPDFSEDD